MKLKLARIWGKQKTRFFSTKMEGGRIILVKNDTQNGIMGHVLLSLFRIIDLIMGSKSRCICLRDDHGNTIPWNSTPFVQNQKDKFIFSSCYMGGDAFASVLKKNSVSKKNLGNPNSEPCLVINSHRMPPLLYPDGIWYPKGPNGVYLPKESLELSLFKKVFSELQFKKELIDRVNSFHEVGPETLGVHVRLTDMNHWHSEYGTTTFVDYRKAIDEVHHKYKNIFVSSDNFPAIERLKKIYGDKVIALPDCAFKGDKEDDLFFLYKTIKWADNPEAWVELFVEVFLLAKCGFLIGRNSAVSLGAVLFSENMNLMDNNKVLSEKCPHG